MKIIKYQLCTRVNHGTDEEPQWEDILFPVTMGWNEANEETAKKEAYNGEYTIEDDGQPAPETGTTAEAQLNAMAAAIERGLTT